MLLRRGIKYRLYPTPEQVALLDSWNGPLRWLWNVGNEAYAMVAGRARYKRLWPTSIDHCADLTELRDEYPWLAAVPRDVCAQLLIQLDLAWQRWRRGNAGRPNWKKKHASHVPMIAPKPTSGGFTLKGTGRRATLTYPKLGSIRAIAHAPLPGSPRRCALIEDCGEWYAAIGCELEVPDPPVNTGPTVAIDRGVVLALADSDGRERENPRYHRAAQDKLRKLKRRRARRKKKGSKRSEGLRLKIARVYRRVRRQRHHWLHVESNYYAKNHGVVIVEDLKIANMTKSAKGTKEKPGKNVSQKRGLNRSILDSGWGAFVTQCEYKLAACGGRVIRVDPAGSSQTCAACGHRDPASRRSQAIFVCVACGHRANADVNAAEVLLSRGKLGDDGRGGNAARGRPVKRQLRVVRRRTRVIVEASDDPNALAIVSG